VSLSLYFHTLYGAYNFSIEGLNFRKNGGIVFMKKILVLVTVLLLAFATVALAASVRVKYRYTYSGGATTTTDTISCNTCTESEIFQLLQKKRSNATSIEIISID
jgi:hypothetical protein